VTTLSRRLVIDESVIHTVLDGEALLLNVETGLYFGLDTVGARMWELLALGTTEEEIVERLLAEYEAPPEQIRDDVREFLQLLTSRGLVRDENG